ncbi:protein of unknown function [Petrocella atlantisensis]|uniref:Uncharacterized protein n=1 Tax=Petrocella atlantisensis TaxID=2173034 RepID=A0A3P7S6M9_9FIRM|nr:protein of unknown function [Petrocella atlantisensis]
MEGIGKILSGHQASQLIEYEYNPIILIGGRYGTLYFSP